MTGTEKEWSRRGISWAENQSRGVGHGLDGPRGHGDRLEGRQGRAQGEGRKAFTETGGRTKWHRESSWQLRPGSCGGPRPRYARAGSSRPASKPSRDETSPVTGMFTSPSPPFAGFLRGSGEVLSANWTTRRLIGMFAGPDIRSVPPAVMASVRFLHLFSAQ